jgi:hypothetical protein
VIGSEFAVDEPILRARWHQRRQLMQQGLELRAGPPDPRIPPGGIR